MRTSKITMLSILLASSLAVSAYADEKVTQPTPVPLEVELIQRDITVAAKSDADFETVLTRRELHGVKLCNSFNAPNKNVEVQGIITNQVGETVWIGSVTKNCTALDTLPEPLDLNEYGFLTIKCRNFDAVERVCRAKALIYGK